MDIGSIFLILAVAVVTILFIARPFFDTGRNQRLLIPVEVHKVELERSALLAERDRVLNALLELDSDHELGKLLPEEHAHQRESLLKSGADALRRLDEINLKEESAGMGTSRSAEDDELEALITARKKVKHAGASAASFCPNCGEVLNPGDRFCSGCGAQTKK